MHVCLYFVLMDMFSATGAAGRDARGASVHSQSIQKPPEVTPVPPRSCRRSVWLSDATIDDNYTTQ